MFNDKIIRISFFISLSGHLLLLGMPGVNLKSHSVKKPREIKVQIEIEKPQLLPKIDVMGKKKKLKTVKAKKLPKPRIHLEKDKIVKKLKEMPKEEIKKIIVKKPKPEVERENKKIKEKTEQKLPPRPVKVINSQNVAMLRYQDMIKQRIESCRRYPDWAKRQGFQGLTYLTFTVLSDGKARDIKIIHSSGFSILDNEAVFTIKRACPFPPIPQEINQSSVSMEVAIAFKIK